MWDLFVSVPDHCLSFYSVCILVTPVYWRLPLGGVLCILIVILLFSHHFQVTYGSVINVIFPGYACLVILRESF